LSRFAGKMQIAVVKSEPVAMCLTVA
jgi:hypothetical protein